MGSVLHIIAVNAHVTRTDLGLVSSTLCSFHTDHIVFVLVSCTFNTLFTLLLFSFWYFLIFSHVEEAQNHVSLLASTWAFLLFILRCFVIKLYPEPENCVQAFSVAGREFSHVSCILYSFLTDHMFVPVWCMVEQILVAS